MADPGRPRLPDSAKEWLDRAEFVTLATLEPDGRPQLSVLWARRDGEDILLSTVKGRRKYANMVRDPRVSVLVAPRDDPYAYVEVRGRVTLSEDGARELIDELSRKYGGRSPFVESDPAAVRVVVRVRPERVVVYRD